MPDNIVEKANYTAEQIRIHVERFREEIKKTTLNEDDKKNLNDALEDIDQRLTKAKKQLDMTSDLNEKEQIYTSEIKGLNTRLGNLGAVFDKLKASKPSFKSLHGDALQEIFQKLQDPDDRAALASTSKSLHQTHKTLKEKKVLSDVAYKEGIKGFSFSKTREDNSTFLNIGIIGDKVEVDGNVYAKAFLKTILTSGQIKSGSGLMVLDDVLTGYVKNNKTDTAYTIRCQTESGQKRYATTHTIGSTKRQKLILIPVDRKNPDLKSLEFYLREIQKQQDNPKIIVVGFGSSENKNEELNEYLKEHQIRYLPVSVKNAHQQVAPLLHTIIALKNNLEVSEEHEQEKRKTMNLSKKAFLTI